MTSLDTLSNTRPHEKIKAEMVHGLGGRALKGYEKHDISSEDTLGLKESFRKDPKDSLAKAREALLSIGDDKSLSPQEKQRQLDSYLDAYFDVTVELDHLAYPPTPEGMVMSGVPNYIPDGFIDMGKDNSIDSGKRQREQIVIDKRAILEKYKPILMGVLGNNYEGVPLQSKKERMVSSIALELFRTMKYEAKAAEALGGDKVNLSEMSEGICRHQGLVFQVLCQSIGIKAQVLKAYRDGGRHSTNMVRLNDQWYIFDVTAPDYQENASGQKIWKPGAYPINSPPKRGERKRYDVTGRFSGEKHTYIAHDEMYWRIEPTTN